LAKIHFLIKKRFSTKGEFFLDELYHRNKIGSRQTMVQKVTSALGQFIEKKQERFQTIPGFGF